MTVTKCALRAACGYRPPATSRIRDTFTRTSTTTLGTTDTGQAWTAHTGTWGTNGTQGYLVTQAGDSVATIDAGSADFDYSIDVTVQGGPALAFRATDANNFLLMFYNPGNGLQFYTKVGGTYTLKTSAALTLGAGSTATWRIVTVGSSITMYVAGVQLITATNTTFQTDTRLGLRVNDGAASRFDNLAVA